MADQASASPLGPDPRVASAIAYAGWWASGALVWLVERDRPAVRFHVILVAGFIVWAICLVQVSRGVDFRLPVVGDWAARLMSRLTSLRSNPRARG